MPLTIDLKELAISFIGLNQAEEMLGIYPQSIVGGPNAYEKRSDWQEGWNACAIALTENHCKVAKWLRSQSERVLELLMADAVFLSSAEDGGLDLSVNCSDLFYWACSDAEDVLPEEVDALYELVEQYPKHGTDLWCCRKRGMRPQTPYYNEKYCPKELWPLFDACGPKRTDA